MGEYKNPEYMKEYRKKNRAQIAEYQKRWASSNPDKIKKYRLKYYYNISETEYDSLLEKSNFACELCKSADRQLHVDHCHTTGKVRGILCFTCNLALGKLGDTTESITRVLRYLEKNNEEKIEREYG